MPRFVVLKHTQDEGDHFDLMLEEGETLLTWSFDEFPAAGISCKCLFNHRLRYLDYEGEISDGRGVVKRVESGTFDMIARMPEAFHITLRGKQLQGNFCLVQSDEDTWTLEAE